MDDWHGIRGLGRAHDLKKVDGLTDGTSIAVACDDNTAYILSTATLATERTFTHPALCGLSRNKADRFASSDEQGNIALRKTEDWSLMHEWHGHSAVIICMCFSDNDSVLVTGSDSGDFSCKVRNPLTAELLTTFAGQQGGCGRACSCRAQPLWFLAAVTRLFASGTPL
eukprot:m.269426 g.269426  ORF g.269426 m.269426 type:complete len:169 (+) comp54739_c2_seq11:21-527(+)